MGSAEGYPPEWPAVALAAKCRAGWTCVRCGHPGAVVVSSDLVRECGGDVSVLAGEVAAQVAATFWPSLVGSLEACRTLYHDPGRPDRYWLVWLDHPCAPSCTHPTNGKRRALTVHHLDGDKGNLAWWNLPPLCQVCHLAIQAKVKMDQTYLGEHTPWMRPYVAGYYAATVLGEDLERDEVEERLDELLHAGRAW